MRLPAALTPQNPVAFFCAEYAIEDALQIYAGGLGVLAGDFILEAGAQGVPFVGIGLFYSGGFSSPKESQNVNTVENLAHSGFAPVKDTGGNDFLITIDVEDRNLSVRVWMKQYGTATLYLLDPSLEQNSAEDRLLTSHLYPPENRARILQELILGIGGVKLLRALGITPSVYHLNEGHASFAALALAAEYMHDHPDELHVENALNAVRANVVVSKHTILPGAGIYFDKEEFRKIISHYFDRHRINYDEFFSWGTDNTNTFFSATRFLIRSGRAGNAVSELHAKFERQYHPRSTLIPITNGVHKQRWRSRRYAKNNVQEYTDAELWSIRSELRAELVEELQRAYGAALDPAALTVVWARRFAQYKRPDILFSDLAALERMVGNDGNPVQCIISGIAHENDAEGRGLMQEIADHAKDARFKGRVLYVPSYNTEIAKVLTKGADVWLNTPERGKEACGTSGMKAGLNGALMCSTSDGWMEEVDWRDKGWILPNEGVGRFLYETIETLIVPEFYTRNLQGIPEKWVERVRKTILKIEERYGAERMLADYMDKLYFPTVTAL